MILAPLRVYEPVTANQKITADSEKIRELSKPPPMRCGSYDMRVEMHGGNGGRGIEQIASTLWKGSTRVAACSAAYIFREEG
eukprot:807593-Amphidinium_carterae.2